jgi:hypothetical protein
MIVHCGSLLLLVALLLQADNSATPGDGFSVAERLQLNSKSKIEDRIKIYESVSSHYHKSVEQAADRQNFEGIPAILQFWTTVLTKSLDDISQNVDRKKKSNALIKFEIQLRKSIVDMRDVRIKAAVDDQDHYDDWIAHAEGVRKQFVDILFPK